MLVSLFLFLFSLILSEILESYILNKKSNQAEYKKLILRLFATIYLLIADSIPDFAETKCYHNSRNSVEKEETNSLYNFVDSHSQSNGTNEMKNLAIKNLSFLDVMKGFFLLYNSVLCYIKNVTRVEIQGISLVLQKWFV